MHFSGACKDTYQLRKPKQLQYSYSKRAHMGLYQVKIIDDH